MLEQHRTRDDAALVADEIFEQLEFARQQRNLAAAAAGIARDQVDGEIADEAILAELHELRDRSYSALRQLSER